MGDESTNKQLRARLERPSYRRAAEKRDELASPHIRSQAQETQHCIDAFPSAMKRATMRREPPERPHCTARCDAVMP
jgi:hypothetical protein